jgi:hypothetical protein
VTIFPRERVFKDVIYSIPEDDSQLPKTVKKMLGNLPIEVKINSGVTAVYG